MAAQAPDSKICGTCGRRFEYHRRWADNWPQVRYCSRRCQGGPGKLDREIEAAIESALAQRAGTSLCPSEIARQLFDDKHWRQEMERVRNAARRLAHADRLRIQQGGRDVDPADFKGPIRLAPR